MLLKLSVFKNGPTPGSFCYFQQQFCIRTQIVVVEDE